MKTQIHNINGKDILFVYAPLSTSKQQAEKISQQLKDKGIDSVVMAEGETLPIKVVPTEAEGAPTPLIATVFTTLGIIIGILIGISIFAL